MPILMTPMPQKHREYNPLVASPFNLLVAEPASRKQRAQNPKAQAACNIEWNKLLKWTTWDPSIVESGVEFEMKPGLLAARCM